jgi:hypothetical protein
MRRERERENKRSKTKRTTTHSDMIAFFLSSLLGFYNTSLCPYVFLSHSTRCYDVREGNFSCKNLSISLLSLSLSLTHKNSSLCLPLCKKKKKKKRIVCDLFSVVYCFPLNNEYTRRRTYSKEFLKRMNDDREEEEENGGENCAALVIEEIEREIERAKKQTFSSSHVVHSVTPRFGSDQEEEDTTNKKKKKEEDENNNENKSREERNRARREAVEWRRKKIEEKTFDPRAAFRERVKKKKNKNDENDETIGGDENDKWQSPSVVMRRRREKNVTVSTRKKSWTELETEWKLFEEKWKDSRGDDENENENENEKQRRRVLRFQDVPFPSSGAGLLTFLISNRGPFSEDENGRKKAKRELAKRWHPDKFAQKFSRLLKDEDKEDVMEMVKEIYQSGTALMNTLSWDG